MPGRQLIVRPGAIGDCILWLPALDHIADPSTDVWISSPVVPLIQGFGLVQSISSSGIDSLGLPDRDPPESLIRKLREYDRVLSWYGSNRPEFRAALESLRVPCQFFPALPPPDYAGHATDFFCTQVGAPLGRSPKINTGATTRRDTAVIHPFSGSARKNWPLDRFRALADELVCAVEWTAGPEEVLPEAVRVSDLLELATWLGGTRLYIGNDSGITHLAAACGVPTLALFGPTSPSIWAPRGPHVTILHRDPLSELDVETVVEAANRLLDLR